MTSQCALLDVPPAQILEICEAWRVSPGSVLFVGDSLEDVEWSFNVGCRTCLIDIGASHTPTTLSSGYVHYGIQALSDLKDIIAATNQQFEDSSG